ncbi:Vacuolar protein sorting-associated protein 54, partial [Glycine soja]
VELHLVKEISLRSSSFFEAQGQLQDLDAKILQGCEQIRHLKDTIRLLDADLVHDARRIQELNGTRTNLLALLQKLRLIFYVNQALSALKLLVASADCAGALDVTDDLQHLLDGDELSGLHCFRHLRDHVIGFIESINSILSAEFIRASLNDAAEKDVIILSKAKARASLPMNGKDDEVKLEEEETNHFKDSLLPTVIGLLRTVKAVTASTIRLVSSSSVKPTFLWRHLSCHVPPPSPAIFFNLFTFCQIYSSPVQSRCTHYHHGACLPPVSLNM